MRPIILEDQHVAVATEASDGDFEVITDPVKALEAIRAGADGIFDVFQPRTNNEELNNLLEKYLEQIHEKGCKQIILQKRCSEEEARKICDKMMAMLAKKKNSFHTERQ